MQKRTLRCEVLAVLASVGTALGQGLSTIDDSIADLSDTLVTRAKITVSEVDTEAGGGKPAVEQDLERPSRTGGRQRPTSRLQHLRAGQNRAPCIDRLDPTALVMPPLGTYGNLSKGTLHSRGLFNTDIGVSRAFAIREGFTANFRAECFNFFKRANFDGSLSSVSGSRLWGRRQRARSIYRPVGSEAEPLKS